MPIARTFNRIRAMLFQKIRNRLILLLILTALMPIFSITLISYYNSSATVERQFVASNLKLIENTNDKLDDYSRKLRESVLGFVREGNLLTELKFYKVDDYEYGNKGYANIENRLLNLMNSRPELDSVYFYVSSVDRLYYVQRQKLLVYIIEHPYMEDISWYSSAVKMERSLFIEDTHSIRFDIRSKSAGGNTFANLEEKARNVLSASFAITDFPNQNIIGAISVSVGVKNLEGIYAKARVDISEKIIVVNRMGHLVYPAEIDGEDKTINTFLNGNYRASVMPNGEESYEIGLDNGKYLILNNHSEYTDWNVIKLIPVSALNAEIINANRYNIVVGSGFIILAAIFSLLLSYNISGPIVRLTKYMENTKIDHLDPPVEIDRQDEIGALYKSYHDMAVLVNELIIKEYKAQLREKQAQIKALQSQINPHFIYNTLQSINGLALEENVPAISDALMSLGNMFRYAVGSSENVVTLREEIAHVESYFRIQKLRYEDNFDYIIQIPDEIADTLIPKLTLQPIVENAIIHGIEKNIDGGKIEIRAWLEDKKVHIHIQDDGVGMQKDELAICEQRIYGTERESSGTMGLALHNVNARLQYAFGEEYGLSLVSAPGEGTTVTLVLKAK